MISIEEPKDILLVVLPDIIKTLFQTRYYKSSYLDNFNILTLNFPPFLFKKNHVYFILQNMRCGVFKVFYTFGKTNTLQELLIEDDYDYP